MFLVIKVPSETSFRWYLALAVAFTLYAVDVAKLEVKGDLTGTNVREALNGHILAQAKISGTYTLTPRLETPKHDL
jgi:hypothetical protein